MYSRLNHLNDITPSNKGIFAPTAIIKIVHKTKNAMPMQPSTAKNFIHLPMLDT